MVKKNDWTQTLFVLVLLVSLSACAPQASPTPSAVSSPTTAPTQALAAFTPGPPFQGLSTGLDNAKLARIRIVSGIVDVNYVDVYINGGAVNNGGVMQQNIALGSFTGWVYLTPGSYNVTLAPAGKTPVQALFTPLAVSAAAGHRYTVAAMGQLKDNSVKPLLIDETALEASISSRATDAGYIFINNTKGADYISIKHDGVLMTKTPYGQASGFFCPGYTQENEELFRAGNPDVSMGGGGFQCHPGASTASIAYGAVADFNSNISNDSQGTSDASVLDFLAVFTSHPAILDDGSMVAFNTLLAAIDKAGLKDLFTSQEPYFFVAPTDAAFAALPKDQLAALLNDPQKLATLIKTYLFPGYFPFGNINGAPYDTTGRDIVNLLGQKIHFQGDSIGVGTLVGPNTSVGNGDRVQVIAQLLPSN